MPTRTVAVELAAHVSGYIAGMRASAQATEELQEEVERLRSTNTRTRGEVSALVGVVGLIPSAVGPATGAALGLTAALSGGIAVATTFGVAVSGMGDALDAVAEGDLPAFLDAMEELAPTARAIVTEYQAVRSEWARLGDQVQDAFWQPMIGDLTQLGGSILPVLNDRLPELAANVGEAGSEFANWAGQADTVAQVDRVLRSTTVSTATLTDTVEPLADLWLDVADAAGPFLQSATRDIRGMVTELSAFFDQAERSGQLAEGFDTASMAVSETTDAVSSLTQALTIVFSSSGVAVGARILFGLLGDGAEAVEDLATAFSDLPDPIENTIAGLVTLGGVAMLAHSGVNRLVDAGDRFAGSLSAIGGQAGSRAATFVQGLSRWGAYGAAAALGLGTVISVIESFGPAAIDVDELSESLLVFAQTGRSTGEMAERLGQDMGALVEAAAAADIEMEQLAARESERNEELADGASRTEALGEAYAAYGDSVQAASGAQADFEERAAATDAAMAQLVQGGHLEQAAALWAMLREEWVSSGRPLGELVEMFPLYSEAAAQAAAANAPLGEGFAVAAQEAALMALGLQELVNQGLSLLDVWRQLNGAAIAFDEAQLAVRESFDALTESIRQNGATLDQNTTAGLQNRVAVGDVAEAAAEAAQAMYEQTGSVRAANDVYNSHISQLRATLRQMGVNEAQIEDIINDYARIPRYIQTEVRTIYTSRGRQYARYAGSSGREPEFDYRWGGVRYARTGLSLTQAHLATGPMVRYGEAATGGEVYVPRNGIDSRSRGLIDLAAGWYGGRVNWGGSGGGGLSDADIGRLVAALDSRPVEVAAVLQVDSVEVARAARMGERSLARRG